jgi:hypothetical protein
MREETVVVGRADRKTVAEAGERQVEHLATVKRRQRTTIADYCGHPGDPTTFSVRIHAAAHSR